MFGRAAIRLGIGPHSSLVSFCTFGLFCTQFYNMLYVFLSVYLFILLFYFRTYLLPEMVNKLLDYVIATVCVIRPTSYIGLRLWTIVQCVISLRLFSCAALYCFF